MQQEQEQEQEPKQEQVEEMQPHHGMEVEEEDRGMEVEEEDVQSMAKQGKDWGEKERAMEEAQQLKEVGPELGRQCQGQYLLE